MGANAYMDVPSTPLYNSPAEYASTGMTRNFKDAPPNASSGLGSNVRREHANRMGLSDRKHGLKTGRKRKRG